MKSYNKEIISQRCKDYFKEEPDQVLHAQINPDNFGPDLIDRMGNYLRFGTAGLRGRMEAGYNRMNIPIVYRLAYAVGTLKKKSSVVIGFDGRHKSKLFAHEAASVLSKLGSEVFIFNEAIPTPICAFATKYLNTQTGIMITASHNPAYDNGIKLYDHTSAQAHGKFLSDLENLMSTAPLRPDFYANFYHESKINYITNEIFNAYKKAAATTSLFDAENLDKTISITYTALHGVGQKYFIELCRENDFNNIFIVKDQADPDGNFPTLSFPNPEEEHTLDLAHEQAFRNHTEWVFANDPDADRLQVSCLDSNKNFTKLNGNQMGSIFGYFAINRALGRGERPLVASSIVSSRMLQSIAHDLGAFYTDALTGFSNIASSSLRVEKVTHSNLVFAYEEAIGFAVGNIVLDKDGLNAGMRFLEIAAWLKKNNKNIWELLDELYIRFGLFQSKQWSQRFDGALAQTSMKAFMNRVKSYTGEEFAKKLNLENLVKYDLSTISNTGPYAGLKANVIIFEDGQQLRLIIRPSGTEPKIKFYLEIAEKIKNSAELSTMKIKSAEKLHELHVDLDKILNAREQLI